MLKNYFKIALKFKIFICLISITLVLGLTACKAPAEKAFDKQLANNLQTALQDAVENPDTKFPGALLYISSPKLGTWVGAAGLGNIRTDTAMRPDDRFRAASILKSFISVVILQLVEEGRFSLDDPMTAVLPESVTTKFSDSDKITVYMLLNHTSGIPDWLTEAIMGEIATNPQRVWKVNEYLDVAAAQEIYFLPGKGWKYSNTDYNLLGLVIEQATGRSWREEVGKRIIKPLNLENTLLPEPGDLSISDNHAHGYHDMGGELFDFTKVDSSMAGAAGGHALITTTFDLARFLNAVLTGELFQNAGTLDEMLELIEVPDDVVVSKYAAGYGLGIMRFILPGNIEMLGHSGATGGFQSFVYYLPTQNLTVSGMMSNVESDQYQILLPALKILIPEFASQR
ncbi:MAG: beta-lactamase family protein [Candidatus Aminicenantes bacterium]|nr:beta-lactamase family protein [Candidatus Aminicenantes bacterium]